MCFNRFMTSFFFTWFMTKIFKLNKVKASKRTKALVWENRIKWRERRKKRWNEFWMPNENEKSMLRMFNVHVHARQKCSFSLSLWHSFFFFCFIFISLAGNCRLKVNRMREWSSVKRTRELCERSRLNFLNDTTKM